MELKKAAMIGCGSMGGGMTLLFAEHGLQICCQDPSEETVDKLIQSVKDQNISPVPTKHLDYEDLCNSLDSPKVFFFSLPHGSVGDTVVDGLQPYLEAGDIIVDCSNELYEHTQRRQGKLVSQGVYYLGVGVSGGYQAARRGPSMCPGGQKEALAQLLPFLEKVAAKGPGPDGKPCVARIGEGGAGHYVKMIHNGIEHGMMSAISESWSFMNTHMGMPYEEISEVYKRWSTEGEMKNMFLVTIAAEICSTKDDRGNAVLAEVQDKVVQDITGEEGTGVWSNEEATKMHIPAPTLSTAHYLRIASAFRGQRQHVKDTFHGSFTADKIAIRDETHKKELIESLRWAVYSACLASFVQGMSIIDAADRANKWKIDYMNIVQIWRNGCIIRADHIGDLLEEIFSGARKTPNKSDKGDNHNLLFETKIVDEFKTGFENLKKIVGVGVQVNAIIPSISATLEWLKYSGNLDLPTQFYEAQLDYFGAHMYDKKGVDAPNATEGKSHYEWKPA